MKYYESVQFRIPFKSHRSIRSIPWHLEILETLHRFMSKERTGNFFEQLERSRAAWEHLRWLCHCHRMSLVWVSINVEHIEHSQSVQLSDWFLFLCRWQPDSTCLLTECQHRSSGRPVFSQLTTSLHGAIYYNIYIYLVWSSFYCFLRGLYSVCCYEWNPCGIFSHRSWQKRGT